MRHMRSIVGIRSLSLTLSSPAAIETTCGNTFRLVFFFSLYFFLTDFETTKYNNALAYIIETTILYVYYSTSIYCKYTSVKMCHTGKVRGTYTLLCRDSRKKQQSRLPFVSSVFFFFLLFYPTAAVSRSFCTDSVVCI